ncbi:MAG: hypothetical protein JWO67_4110 [Streptosporangiaceae bacterium]|nr:hypothetical protein [Streptosporangiaceae bacterium]
MNVGVGDVLAVKTGGIGGALIRFGAWLRGLPHGINHVVIAHHLDDKGALIGLEGRPGGVGWVDMRDYLASPATVSNADQPKTDEQRYTVAKHAEAMLRAPYDWPAIVADAGCDLGLPSPDDLDWNGNAAPLHVVCSSYAAYLYRIAGLARPGPTKGGRFVQPADWAQWDAKKGWQ